MYFPLRIKWCPWLKHDPSVSHASEIFQKDVIGNGSRNTPSKMYAKRLTVTGSDVDILWLERERRSSRRHSWHNTIFIIINFLLRFFLSKFNYYMSSLYDNQPNLFDSHVRLPHYHMVLVPRLPEEKINCSWLDLCTLRRDSRTGSGR